MLENISEKSEAGLREVRSDTTHISSTKVRYCKVIDGLNALNDCGTELVLWQRNLRQDLLDWIEQLAFPELPYLQVLVRPSDVRNALEPLLEQCGLYDSHLRELLVGDISDLTYMFSEITESERVDLRLERIDHDACWRFHKDVVEARLVTTYLGPATEWVDPAFSEEAINEQKNFRGPVKQFNVGDVAIFKGKSANHGSGIVHRSPPIKGTGNKRLFLCLNKQTEISPEPWDAI